MTELVRSNQQSKLATTPRESFESEAEIAAGMAWAKESRNYEVLIHAFRAWILQRRHTTQLIEPAIKQGRPVKGNESATILGDFGFTRSQWFRRKKELRLSEADVDSYLDMCIEQTRTPSLYGMLRAVSEGDTVLCTCGRPHLPGCPAYKRRA